MTDYNHVRSREIAVVLSEKCPHQYVLARRVERAEQLLQTGGDFSLAEVAAYAGFSDQSQFSHHFKRLVGVTPGQFRTRVRTD
jgi:AraC family transcriptional regulator